jgi:teichoic acid transport system permease protein
VLRGGSRPEAFIPVLISGILHWQVTSLALNQGANSVSGGKNLMLNSTFPRMLLPIASVYTGVLQFAPSVIVIFAALLLLDASITIHILWWLPLFVTQIAICLGIALIFSTAIVFISDMKNLVGYLVRIMFFTSPIIFPLDVIPPDIVNVIRWMPFFGIFANYQRIMSGTAIDTTTYAISLTWAIATMVLGVWLFLRYEREFASHVS